MHWRLLGEAPASAWFFTRDLPSEWQWITLGLTFVGLLVAVVALLMALPPILQMLFGGPRIGVSLTTDEREGVSAIRCNIRNRPVANNMLKKIGVRRQSADPSASVFLHCRGVCVSRWIPSLRSANLNDGGDKMRTLVASDVWGLYFIVGGVTGKGQRAMLDNGQNSRLEPGTYQANIVVLSGEDMINVIRDFVVTPERIYWAEVGAR
jgi:hypothetical protein